MSERDEFEAWMREELQFDGEDGDPCKRGQCGYLESNVDSAWCAWQARAARAPQAVPALTDEQIRDALHEAGFCVGGGPVPDIWIETDGLYDGLNRVRRLVSILAAAPQPSPEPEKAAEPGLEAIKAALRDAANTGTGMYRLTADGTVEHIPVGTYQKYQD